MKKYIKHILPAALIAFAIPAFAQNTYSGYFLDNYMYSFEMNPAKVNMGKTGFVGFPALGNLRVGMQGNLHVSDVLYNYNGQTVLFANPNISATEVMKHISNKNAIGGNTKINLLTAGFKAFGGQNVVSLSAVGNANVSAPKSIFSLIKEGVSNSTYDIKNLRAQASGYAQLQFNHQRDLGKYVPGLQAGAAFKMLFGMANLDAYFDEAYLELGEDAWRAHTKGNMYMNIGNSRYKTKVNDRNGQTYVNGLDIDGIGVNGFGIGFDLGATYKWRDFDFSLALLDLGFISWSKTQQASTNGVREVDTSLFTFGVEGTEAEDTWHELEGKINELYQFEDLGNVGTRTRALRATLNWGVEYELPYYRRLHFGMVNSTCFNSAWTTTEFRFSANVRPVDCFSASANLVAGTYGCGFGWLMNVNVTGFNFFIGMDHTLGKLTKQGLPLNSNAQVNLGINFPF